MRDFVTHPNRAAALPLGAKILYTVFVAYTFIGLLATLPLYDRVVKFEARATPRELYQHLVDYYAVQQPRDRLLDVTHSHLFSMPMYLLVLGHLLLLSRLSARAKAGWIAFGAVMTGLHLLAPWIANRGATAWIYPVSGAGLFAAFAVMGGVAVFEMWQRPPGSKPS